MNKAVFLDRDDTVIVDVPYNGDPSKVKLVANAAHALQNLKNHGFLLFIISNQSGVGRGYIRKEQVDAVNEEMINQLGENFFSAIYSCYDAPDSPQSGCRKPSPQMLYAAAEKFDIDIQNSYIIGDKTSDVQAGINAGCHPVLLKTEKNSYDQEMCTELADYQATSLLDASTWILDQQHE